MRVVRIRRDMLGTGLVDNLQLRTDDQSKSIELLVGVANIDVDANRPQRGVTDHHLFSVSRAGCALLGPRQPRASRSWSSTNQERSSAAGNLAK